MVLPGRRPAGRRGLGGLAACGAVGRGCGGDVSRIRLGCPGVRISFAGPGGIVTVAGGRYVAIGRADLGGIRPDSGHGGLSEVVWPVLLVGVIGRTRLVIGLVEALVSQILVVSDLVGEFGFEPGITCRLEIATGMALSIQLRAESNVEWGRV